MDVYNQAIGHIIQKIQSFFAYSLIQMLYESHTIQSTHEKTSSKKKENKFGPNSRHAILSI